MIAQYAGFHSPDGHLTDHAMKISGFFTKFGDGYSPSLPASINAKENNSCKLGTEPAFMKKINGPEEINQA